MPVLLKSFRRHFQITAILCCWDEKVLFLERQLIICQLYSIYYKGLLHTQTGLEDQPDQTGAGGVEDDGQGETALLLLPPDWEVAVVRGRGKHWDTDPAGGNTLYCRTAARDTPGRGCRGWVGRTWRRVSRRGSRRGARTHQPRQPSHNISRERWPRPGTIGAVVLIVPAVERSGWILINIKIRWERSEENTVMAVNDWLCVIVRDIYYFLLALASVTS